MEEIAPLRLVKALPQRQQGGMMRDEEGRVAIYGNGCGAGFGIADTGGDGFGAACGAGFGDGFCDGDGAGYSFGDGFWNGPIYGSGCGHGFGSGSGAGSGHGDGYGDGYGFCYGSGSGYGFGYGAGFGNGFGFGYGYGYGEGHAIGKVRGYTVSVVWPGWLKVGCRVHSIAAWRERWKDIAEMNGVKVSNSHARRLLSVAELVNEVKL